MVEGVQLTVKRVLCLTKLQVSLRKFNTLAVDQGFARVMLSSFTQNLSGNISDGAENMQTGTKIDKIMLFLVIRLTSK